MKIKNYQQVIHNTSYIQGCGANNLIIFYYDEIPYMIDWLDAEKLCSTSYEGSFSKNGIDYSLSKNQELLHNMYCRKKN
ncbi:hypothetical protein MKY41_16120 [Sporosarcina sp. FSL W7-1349]|uniref:hypothetical protein n=1 Tax=Sporosarcina sp. FSL W7-1349 TaxID=2921561 RepID=UPI0030FA6983